MSYSAKVSRKGGSLKRLFVIKKSPGENNYCCVEDQTFDFSTSLIGTQAELDSQDDILSAWVNGLDESEQE